MRWSASWSTTLRHDLTIEGAGFRLRPVANEDAAFILTLRTDPALARYLHPVSGVLEDQLAWLEAYFQRSGDYYFIVERVDSGAPVGTIALVDAGGPGGAAEWGRWILLPGSLAAVASAWLIYRLAFERLQLASVYCNTVEANEQVVSFHDSCGLERTATLPAHFDLGGRQEDAVQHTLFATRWPAVEGPLRAKATRLHGLLSRRT